MSERIYQHFITIQPGLEEILHNEITHHFLASEELKQRYQIEDIQQKVGGIELACPLSTTEYLLKRLKTPTKILLRIETFKANSFPKLFKKTESINWSNYFKFPSFQINAHSSKSRLIHTQRICETISDGIDSYYKKHPASDKLKAKLPKDFIYPLLVRLNKDVCTISIDISQGLDQKAFYQKGLKSKNAKASLRENIAYAMLFLDAKLAKQNLIFLDPMAGAGTLAIMAMQHQAPLIEELTFHHLRLAYPKLKNTEPTPIAIAANFQLNDWDEHHYKFLSENFKTMENCQISQMDYKNLKLEQPSQVFCNLPYGKRIKINKQQFLTDLFHWCQNPQIKYFCFLAPANWQQDFTQQGFTVRYQFKNGGFPVAIYTKTKS